jgi:hypothetical protein
MGSNTLDAIRQNFYDLMDEGQNQNYISLAVANQFINNAYAAFFNFIVTQDPWLIFEQVTFTPIVGQGDLPLPSDFRNALKVYAQPITPMNNVRYIPMRQFNAGNYALYGNNNNHWYTLVNPIPKYRIMGQVLRLDPAPSQAPVNYNVVMWYTPQPAVLSDSNAGISNVFSCIQGHEQWITNQAVIYAKMKEEVSFGDLAAMNDGIKAQISQDIAMRDHGGGNQILDTMGLIDYHWQGGNGSWL